MVRIGTLHISHKVQISAVWYLRYWRAGGSNETNEVQDALSTSDHEQEVSVTMDTDRFAPITCIMQFSCKCIILITICILFETDVKLVCAYMGMTNKINLCWYKMMVL